ncbi:hypothetical protein HK100_003559 [Physocladia obscura]|uniref:Uncharacterized protein n=1 Tax=Physocladia obscura TaxID=109957 RepID=A0AAD5XJA4_9FUNG|nr:hypothetical protein HK100_003559 [Physocladia obscura]
MSQSKQQNENVQPESGEPDSAIQISGVASSNPKKNQLKHTVTRLFEKKKNEGKLFKVAQMAISSSKNGDDVPFDIDNSLGRFVAATEAIIAAQQFQEIKNLTKSPVSIALSTLIGLSYENVNDFLPQFLHTPVINLASLKDQVLEKFEIAKKFVDQVVLWESVKNSLYITSGVFSAWFIGYWNLGVGWMQIDAETVEWLNNFVDHFWLQFEPTLSESLRNIIDPILSSSKPSFLDDLSLTVFTLGSVAPRINTIKTVFQSVEDIIQMELEVLFVPVDEDGVSKRQKELGTVRHSKIEVVAKIGKGSVAIPIPVVVSEIEFRAKLKLDLKFVSKYPHVESITYSFEETPKIDFTLRPLKTLDIMDTPALKASLNNILAYALAGFVYPSTNSINLDAMLNGTDIGVLKITLHEAKNLKNMELAGVSDPYVLIAIGGKIVGRTKAIENSLNPYWGQTLFIPVMSSNLHFKDQTIPGAAPDELTFEIFDKNENGKDKTMGSIKPLKLSRWTKLLETGNSTDTARGIDSPKVPPLSRGPELTSDERDSLITDWGTPFSENGDDVWHTISLKDSGPTVNEIKRQRGELRLEISYILLQDKDRKSPLAPSKSEDNTISLISTNEEDSLTSGILTVNVHSGKEFSTSRQSTLKCEIHILGVEFPPNNFNSLVGSTQGVKKTGNPKWESPIRFYVMDSKNAICKFEIKDGSKLIGFVELKVSQIIKVLSSKESDSDWFPLSNRIGGKIRLTFAWNPTNPQNVGEKSVLAKGREPQGVVKIKLLKAKALINVEIMGRKSDPYAKINIGRELVGATLVKDNTLDPVWNETFYGVFYSPKQKVLIELWDFNNVKKDKSLGRVELTFKDIQTYNDDSVEKSAEILKLKNDGLRVELSGNVYRVVAPIYLKKIEDLENSSFSENNAEQEQDQEASVLVKPVNKIRRAETERIVQAALLQRGFLYFEMETYGTAGAHIIPLDMMEIEYIERKKDELQSEIRRIRKLQEVKVLTEDVANLKIEEIEACGCIGEINQAQKRLLELPTAKKMLSEYDAGMLYIDLQKATNLEAVDHGGTSDPYCLIYLNDDLIHKTETHKKNLNPIFKESVNCGIQSRLKSTINFTIKDFNVIGKHTTLGTIELDLAEIKSMELKNFIKPLSGARHGELHFSVFFDHKVAPRKKKETTATVDAASARLEDEENAAIKMAKGVGLGTKEAFENIGKVLLKGNIAGVKRQEHVITAADVAMKQNGIDISHILEHESLVHDQNSDKDSKRDEDKARSGTVLLTIQEAKNLKAVDENGKADPYIKVNQILHGKKTTLLKTKVIKKELNPKWHESVVIKVPPSTITLVVKDKNTFGASKPLGEVELDLELLLRDAPVFEQWVDITLGGTGSILVKAQLTEDRNRAASMRSRTSSSSDPFNLVYRNSETIRYNTGMDQINRILRHKKSSTPNLHL